MKPVKLVTLMPNEQCPSLTGFPGSNMNSNLANEGETLKIQQALSSATIQMPVIFTSIEMEQEARGRRLERVAFRMQSVRPARTSDSDRTMIANRSLY